MLAPGWTLPTKYSMVHTVAWQSSNRVKAQNLVDNCVRRDSGQLFRPSCSIKHSRVGCCTGGKPGAAKRIRTKRANVAGGWLRCRTAATQTALQGKRPVYAVRIHISAA